MKSDFIWMDGELVPFAVANVHIITPTLHYGVGVFEGIRAYSTPDGPAILGLEEHPQLPDSKGTRCIPPARPFGAFS